MYFLLKSEGVSTELEMAASGTSGSHQRVNSDDMLNVAFVIPNKERIRRFSQLVEPNLKKRNSNQFQIRTLENLRDTLLPKLMSGEVCVRL